MIAYPTIAEVDAADYETLRQWRRNLPEPGTEHQVAHPVTGDFFSPSSRAWQASQYEDFLVLSRICDRIGEIETQLSR
jgi:hypothetical protein